MLRRPLLLLMVFRLSRQQILSLGMKLYVKLVIPICTFDNYKFQASCSIRCFIQYRK